MLFSAPPAGAGQLLSCSTSFMLSNVVKIDFVLASQNEKVLCERVSCEKVESGKVKSEKVTEKSLNKQRLFEKRLKVK